MQELNLEGKIIDNNNFDKFFDKKNLSNIIMLNLDSNYLGDQGIKKLAELLIKNPNIRRLNIANNIITSDGFNKFAEILQNTKVNFEYINISKNDLSKFEDVNFIKFLLNFKELKILRMNDVNVSHKNLEILIGILKDYPNLLEIQLQSNEIDDAFFALLKSIKLIKTNCKIDVTYNGFSEEQEKFLLLNDEIILTDVFNFLKEKNIYDHFIKKCQISRSESFFTEPDNAWHKIDKINTLKFPHRDLIINNQKLREKFMAIVDIQINKSQNSILQAGAMKSKNI